VALEQAAIAVEGERDGGAAGPGGDLLGGGAGGDPGVPRGMPSLLWSERNLDAARERGVVKL
jgi:hypothetical protein